MDPRVLASGEILNLGAAREMGRSVEESDELDVGAEALEARIGMQGIETGVYPKVRNPARSFPHRTRQPAEGEIAFPECGLDDAELVGEQPCLPRNRSRSLATRSAARRS